MYLFKQASIVSLWIMFSRVLGLVREVLLAASLGASLVTDAFLSAFRLPNTLRMILAEGAMHGSFTPSYGKKLHSSQEEAQVFAGQILSLIFLFALLISILSIIFMPQVMSIFSYGFLKDPEKFSLTVYLARIVFPYIILMTIASFMTSILNSHKFFMVGSMAPSLLNISMTSVLLLLYFEIISSSIAETLCISVLIAGLLHLSLLTFSLLRMGLLPKPKNPFMSKQVKEFLLLFFPIAFASGITHINSVIGHILATTLTDGSVAYLYYAERINQLPVAIIGFAIATVLLPQLRIELNESDDLNVPPDPSTPNQAVDTALLVTMPAAFGIIATSNDIIVTIYQHGAFSENDAILTAQALLALAIGVPAFVGIKIFSSIFFSRQNTKTIAIVAISATITNLVVSLSLMPFFQHIGIAIASSVSAWTNLSLIVLLMSRLGYWSLSRPIVLRLIIYFLCSLFMAVALRLLDSFIHLQEPTSFMKIMILSTKICLGIILYVVTLLWLSRFLPLQLRPLILQQRSKTKDS